METEVVVALVGGGFGLAGTIGGTLLGMYVNGRSAVRTALQLAEVEHRKYAQQRLWDDRRAAYNELVTAITDLSTTSAGLCFGLYGESANVAEVRSCPIAWCRIEGAATSISGQAGLIRLPYRAA